MLETAEAKVKKIEDLTRAIRSLSTEQERKFLYLSAQQASPEGVIVEIGSWKGKSTIFLAAGSGNGGKGKGGVYAIDPFPETLDEFKKNIQMAGLTDVVVPIAALSEEAVRNWDKPISFLFIDGAHEYEAVIKDFRLWFPFLISGGIVAFHDVAPSLQAVRRGIPLYGFSGPRDVVFKYLIPSKDFGEIGTVDSIVYARKGKKNYLQWRLARQMVALKIFCVYALVRLYFLFRRLPNPVKKMLKKWIA